MEREHLLQRYYELVGHDSLKARNEILKLSYKNDAYLLSCVALTYKDEAMFFKNGNMRKEFIKEKLLIAKKYIDKSFQLNPRCRDILFTKGEIYNALDDRFEAIDCYIKIIEFDEKLNKLYNCSRSDFHL
jgi:tetratricopeptide (TPR) repeat protein